jgi:hypothetical protein
VAVALHEDLERIAGRFGRRSHGWWHPAFVARLFAQGSLTSRWSDAYPVAEVNDAASEAVFVQEVELDANVIRQCALSTTDDNRAEE